MSISPRTSKFLLAIPFAALVLSGVTFGVRSVHAQGIGGFGPPPVIVCRQDGSYTQPGYNRFQFTAAQCGGLLPGPGYAPAISRVNVAGGLIDFAAYDASEGGPALYAWAMSGKGPYSIAVTYISTTGFGPPPIQPLP
jgi:hypothetical protein